MSMIYGLPTGVNAKMPYQPAIDEILYVEGKHTIKIDRWRIEYYSKSLKIRYRILRNMPKVTFRSLSNC